MKTTLTLALLIIISLSACSRKSDKQKLDDEINTEAADIYTSEVVDMQLMYQSLSDINISEGIRLDNLQRLKDSYPELLHNMTLENANSSEYADIINNKIIPSIIAQAKAQVIREIIIEKQTKLIKKQAQEKE